MVVSLSTLLLLADLPAVSRLAALAWRWAAADGVFAAVLAVEDVLVAVQVVDGFLSPVVDTLLPAMGDLQLFGANILLAEPARLDLSW